MSVRKSALLSFFRRRSVRGFWGPVLLFIALSAVMTWPLALHLRTEVIGGAPGDNWYYVWLITWFQKTLFHPGLNPLDVPSQNYPDGWNLAYSEITLANVLPALPVARLGGAVLGYNIVLLLSFALSGLVVFWWAKKITGRAGAALLAGTLFTFAPFRLAHIYGHWPLMGTQYIALHFLGLYGLLRARAFSWKYGLAAGAGLGLAAHASMYYLYMTAIVSAGFILGDVLFVDRRRLFRASFWRNAAFAAAVALPFLASAAWPYLRLNAQGVANHRTLKEVDLFSASPTDFLLPAPVHVGYGPWILDHFDRSMWIEQTLYLGVVGLALAGAALALRRRNPDLRKTVTFFAFLLGLAVILAMGTHLYWLNRKVAVSLPGFLARVFGTGEISIPLPNLFFFKSLPFYDALRTWMRYGIYASLFASLLAAIGWAAVVPKFRTRRAARATLALVLALALFDVYSGPYPMSRVAPRPVDRWLAGQPGEGSFVQLPIELSYNTEVIYGTLAHGRPFFGMFYGGFLPADFMRNLPVLWEFPTEESVRILRARGVEYVLVDTSRYDRWPEVEARILALGLAKVADIEGQTVYRLSGRN